MAITNNFLSKTSNHALAVLAALLLGASGANLHAVTFSDDNWNSMSGYPGANDPVLATVVDGSGNLYIGGMFTIVGDVFANHIAKWNGTHWSALGSGLQRHDLDRAVVHALAVSGNDLYVAGYFTSAGGIAATNIAKWNGTNWSALGSGIIGEWPYLSALAVSGSALYAAGRFTNAGGIAANNIAKWNGSSWSALGSGLNGPADALAVSGSDLYVAGPFTNAGGIMVNRIAKWNGSSWSALGSGVEGFDYLGHPNASVSALAVSGHDLYVAGYFSRAGGLAITNMAKWNGSTWSAFPWPIYGVSEQASWGDVSDLTFSGNELYAGGVAEISVGGGAYYYDAYVVKWNGSNWSPLEPGLTGAWQHEWDSEVVALAVSGTNVYAGGTFTRTGNSDAHCVARWNGSNWSGMGPIFGTWGHYLNVITASGRDVYGAILFTPAGGVQSNYLARWNGSGWSRFGSGTVSNVYALAASGNDLYAGGDFTNAAGVAANGIARWDGTNWSALGSGVSRYASRLAVSGKNIYVGGSFSTAGGIPANNIAKWDGTNWSALGSGMNVYVAALAVSGNDLYAAGDFDNSSGVVVNRIAKWNGTNWSELSGLHGNVNALAVVGTNLYAGGYFIVAGAAYPLAKWNGSSWSIVVPHLEEHSDRVPSVQALAAVGSDLYVGGWFQTPAGERVNIAKWDGTHWSALGSGVDGTIGTLVATDTELFALGEFTMAGGKVSPHFARARIGSEAQAVTASNSTASIRFSGVTGYLYSVQRATNLTPPIDWTTVTTTPLYPASDGSFTFIDTSATPGAAYYRARLNNVYDDE